MRQLPILPSTIPWNAWRMACEPSPAGRSVGDNLSGANFIRARLQPRSGSPLVGV